MSNRKTSGKFESSNLSRDNLSREIGRTQSWCQPQRFRASRNAHSKQSRSLHVNTRTGDDHYLCEHDEMLQVQSSLSWFMWKCIILSTTITLNDSRHAEVLIIHKQCICMCIYIYIYDILYMIYDVWCMMYDIYGVTSDLMIVSAWSHVACFDRSDTSFVSCVIVYSVTCIFSLWIMHQRGGSSSKASEGRLRRCWLWNPVRLAQAVRDQRSLRYFRKTCLGQTSSIPG